MSERKVYPSTTADKFMLRFPDGMRDKLSAAAKANGRSVNAEIIIRLGGTPDAPRASRMPASQPSGLRDDFAMEALRGLIPDCGLSPAEMAQRCYEVADAMLTERGKW